MSSTLNWYGNRYTAAIETESGRRLDTSAIMVLNRVRVLLSVSGTANRGRRRSRLYGVIRSRPGESPRKQYGRLRASYTWERDGLTARVGTSYKVARHLELGTRKMSPRPHLRPAFRDTLPRIRALWARPMRIP